MNDAFIGSLIFSKDKSKTFPTYAKFNGYGVQLPFNVLSDYKITLTFYESSYVVETALLGSSNNNIRMPLAWTEYGNKWFVSDGRNETNFGSWVGGVDHTIVVNNGNNHNELDGVEVTAYNGSNTQYDILIGCCNTSLTGRGWHGYLKEFKIESNSTGTLICRIIPCKIENEPCLYDTVADMYYIVTDLTVANTPS